MWWPKAPARWATAEVIARARARAAQAAEAVVAAPPEAVEPEPEPADRRTLRRLEGLEHRLEAVESDTLIPLG